jgi:hypothetical protein
MRQQMLPYSIKVASIEDKERILPLMLSFKEESSYSLLETDKEEILSTIENYLLRDKKDTIVLLALDSSNSIIGIIVGTSSKLPFNKLLQAAETIWYVYPEYRKDRIGYQLYETFMYWATNIVRASVIHTASPKGSNLKKVYKKQGYDLLEELYIKVL